MTAALAIFALLALFSIACSASHLLGYLKGYKRAQMDGEKRLLRLEPGAEPKVWREYGRKEEA